MPKKTFELCDKRKAILVQAGHLLVLGGPGSGKTTISLLKAKEFCNELRPGQEILFLSFSRAAVRQVLARCDDILTRKERALLTVKTYHSFCIETLQSYGRMLSGRRPRILFPRQESLLKSDHDGSWDQEVSRLAEQEGMYCFDAVAGGIATLFEKAPLVLRLYAAKFPFIVVDEFQDTDESQWRIVRALAAETTVFILADTEQRIFDYRKDIDPERIDKARELLSPAVFDLAGDNYRSPNAGILKFADAVLKNQPLPSTTEVRFSTYHPKKFEAMVHIAVINMFDELRKCKAEHPTVAVLCRSNPLVANVSAILSEARQVSNGARQISLPAIEHSVVWDAELAASAAGVVASILEWPTKTPADSVVTTLAAISAFYRLKNALHPSNAAKEESVKCEKAIAAVRHGKSPTTKTGKALVNARSAGVPYFGDPAEDWLSARGVLLRAELKHVFAEARMMRFFQARDEVGSALAAMWLKTGGYAGATRVVEQALDRQLLMSTEREPTGCILMSMHKSKGKEFDGVILVEGTYSAPFFDAKEKPPHPASRRLLRVSITRARSRVLFVRPNGAQNLTG